jgi:UDP-glucose 4-epimerase
MSMRVMVTGGAGFIGSHVADALLAAGHEVGVIDDLSTGSRDNLPATVPLHVIDIRDRDAVFAAFAAFRPEVVCHQAAQMSVSRSVRDPLFDAEVNAIGLINVLDAAVAQKCGRVVFASSGGVLYGEQTSPAPEETPADPVSPYGITKWVGERYLKFYAAEHGLGAMALRYANVYGPRQNPHGEAGVVAIFLKRYLAGQTATINGDGHYVRDYVYGGDNRTESKIGSDSWLARDFGAKAGTAQPFGVGLGAADDALDANHPRFNHNQDFGNFVFGDGHVKGYQGKGGAWINNGEARNPWPN